MWRTKGQLSSNTSSFLPVIWPFSRPNMSYHIKMMLTTLTCHSPQHGV